MDATTATARLRAIQQELAAAWTAVCQGQTSRPPVPHDARILGRATARDRTTIERLIAPDWQVTHVAGQRLTRPDVFREMFEADANHIESMTADEVDVRVFGDAAIVTGRTHAHGSQSGVPYDLTLRFTDVFVRRGGDWQAVASHATLIQ